MQINIIRSDIYQELLELPFDKREGCFQARFSTFCNKISNTTHSFKSEVSSEDLMLYFYLAFMNQLLQLSQKRIDRLSTPEL